MFHIYILKSEVENWFYTGLTQDLSRRMNEHQAGHVRPTRNKRPLQLVYTESFVTRSEARRREKFFKSGEGRELRKAILERIPR